LGLGQAQIISKNTSSETDRKTTRSHHRTCLM
jgi:hypothetical protein